MRKAYFNLFLVTVIWGTTFPIQKLIIDGVSPTLYIAFRFAIAGLISLFIWGMGDLKRASILGTILGLSYTTQTIGLKFTTASKNGFLTSLYVVLVPLVSWIIEKERPTKLQAMGFFFAFVGSYLLSGGIEGFNFGDFLSFLCAVGFSFHVVLISFYSRKMKETDLLTLQFFTTALINFLLSFFEPWRLSLLSVPVAIYTAIFATALGIYFQVKHQKEIGSNAAALIFAGEPVFSALFSYLILGETMTVSQMIGGGLLFLSLVLAGGGRR